MRGRNYRKGIRLLAVSFTLLFSGLFQSSIKAALDASPASSTSDSSHKAIIAPQPVNFSTKECAPCSFQIGEALPRYSISFEVRNLPDTRRVVDELQVRTEGKTILLQSLPVHDMAPVTRSQEFFIGTADINFDGYNDLFLATSRGVANTYADYWLFVPSKQSFSYLGNFPVFTVNRSKHRLSSYERGGHGGMIYTASTYAFIDGVLTLVVLEKQEATDQDGRYVKKIFKAKSGKLRLIKIEAIRAPVMQ